MEADSQSQEQKMDDVVAYHVVLVMRNRIALKK